MAWRALVDTDTQLAAILGVARPAIVKAERRGKIERTEAGRWDAVRCLERWRMYTHPGLQRPERAREFRPWLDPATPLTECIWQEVVRPAAAQGAEWEDSD